MKPARKMKTYYNILRLAMAWIIVAFISISCDETEGITEKDQFIELISGVWTIDENSEITLDDQDITSVLEGFEIMINEDLTFTTNSDELQLTEFPWPVVGQFVLSDDLTQLTRNDGVIIDLVLIAEEDALNFEYEIASDSSAKVIGGKWKCKFHRK